MNLRIVAHCVLVGAFLALGCRSAGGRGTEPNHREPYLITADELEHSRRANLYDAVFEMRPRWFTRSTRGVSAEAYVYVDDQAVGTTGALRRFTLESVAEVRYLSPTEAQVQFGQRNYGRAAIIVVMAR